MNPEFTGGYNNLKIISSVGGLNTTASPLTTENNETPDIQNCDLDLWGRIIKRLGYLNLNSEAVNSGAGGTGIHYFETPDGTNYLVAVFGDKIYKVDDLDGTFDDITNTAVITDNDRYQWQFKVYNATLLCSNGVDIPIKWTGTGNVSTWTLPTNMTRVETLEVWSDFVFVANVTISGTDYKNRLYWSSPGTTETWNDADWINVNKDDGQEIVCIKSLGDKLIIFKQRSIYILSYTGDTDIPFVIYKSPSHVGCISKLSIQDVANGLIFLSYDGFYYFDGSNSTKISDKINYTFANDLSVGSFQYAVSSVFRSKNQYMCALTLSGDANNSLIYIYDYYNKNWYRYTDISVNALCNLYEGMEERLYFLDYSGFCYRLGIGLNDYPLGVKTAISSYYKTKWFNFDELIYQKGIPYVVIYVNYSSASLIFGYSYDFEDTVQYSQILSLSSSTAVYDSAIYGTSTYAGSGGFSYRFDLTGRGMVLQLTFSNNSEDETFTINGFGIAAYAETIK